MLRKRDVETQRNMYRALSHAHSRTSLLSEAKSEASQAVICSREIKETYGFDYRIINY